MRLSSNTIQLLMICLCVLIVIWVLHRMTLPLDDIIPLQTSSTVPPLYTQEPPWESKPEELFTQNMEGYNTSRIPALIFHKDTFFAFCEGRKDTHRDIGKMEILLRRGKLRGRSVEWNPIQVVARKHGHRVMNPSPVVEKELDIILMVFLAIPAWVSQKTMWRTGRYQQQVMVTRSFDMGKTWTLPFDITESTIAKISPMISIYAPGPGHGLQLQTGRIVIAGNYLVQDAKSHSRAEELNFNNNSGHANVIWSDDRGFTWHLGGSLDQSEMDVLANEAIAVEVDNGVICLNSRTLEAHKPRIQAFSRDEGNTFSKGIYANELVEPGFGLNENKSLYAKDGGGCQGSMIGFPAPNNNDVFKSKTWVLFSNPASKLLRVNMSVRISQDGCHTWSKPWQIHKNVSGYSDLTYFEMESKQRGDEVTPKTARTQAFAILYEGGYENYWDRIYFKMFNLEAVLKGVRESNVKIQDVPSNFGKSGDNDMPDVG